MDVKWLSLCVCAFEKCWELQDELCDDDDELRVLIEEKFLIIASVEP